MAREATGEVRRNSDGSFSTLVRTFEKRETFQLPTCSDEAQAGERSRLVAQTAKRFRDASVNRAQGIEALKILAAASPKALRAAVLVCEELLGGEIPVSGAPKAPKFSEVATDWTSGKLHRLYPDHVKAKDWTLDASRLTKLSAIDVGGTTLGDLPIDRVTLDHAERAMRSLPPEAKRPATRRQYAQLIHRVLALSVYPCRHIAANPLPKGFMPKAGKAPAYAFLYPSEDAALLGNARVSLGYRLLYGFLAREGLRISEAMGLTWKDLDLDRGVVTLDRNKTDDARAWALNPGVARALKLWKERSGHAFVFAYADGILDTDGIAERLRNDLLSSGVTRAELHNGGENRGRFRVHDLRGTFVTLSLANGKSETWVADRTGHTSSQMINRYRRAARSAQELELGELASLDEAIDWSDDCHSIATHLARPAGFEPATTGFEERTAAERQAEETAAPRAISSNANAETHAEPRPEQAEWRSRGNPAPSADPVEAALAVALEKASAAGEWSAVTALARELEARRKAREAPEVVSLDAARAKRERVR